MALFIPTTCWLGLCINFFLLIHQVSAQSLLNCNCTNTAGNYTQDSLFQANLYNIITSAPFNPLGFSSRTLGRGADQVNAVASCWHLGSDDYEPCRRCIKDAAINLTKFCPNQKEAIGWMDGCVFGYSNKNMYGNMSLTPFYLKKNSTRATNAYLFSRNLTSLADSILGQMNSTAMFKPAVRIFTQVSNISNGETIYGFMQCDPAFSVVDCVSCLNHTKKELLSCCDEVVGASYQTPSCMFRFEIYPFFYMPYSYDFPGLSGPFEVESNKTTTIIIVVCAVVASLVLSVILVYVLITRRRRRRRQKAKTKGDEELKGLTEIYDTQTRRYDFAVIRAATDDFSAVNKLGRGGFGEVYKGLLSDGKKIAVKRLSTTSTSGQGNEEFMNEVKSLAKLQHRCLVKLMGFCLERKEKLLIYEFMENGSLDKFLFDPVNRSRLDWEHRFKILKSVARGIHYLHEDSRMRVIHRDLKASNILLDEEMDAKISDFGLAKLSVLDEGEVHTNRIAGTYGYMAPEYAMRGLFSVKSDVYSYGVLLLEIICGRRTYFSLTRDGPEYLPAYVYKIWRENKSPDVIDPMLSVDAESLESILRCIHIALLCVQEAADHRPKMAAVNHMLHDSMLTLPTPGPCFCVNNTETTAWTPEPGSYNVSTGTVATHATSSYGMLLNDDETDSYQYPR